MRNMAKLSEYIKLARPNHYIKNGFVWIPLFFAHKLNDLHAVFNTFWAFFAFCLTASAVYILNDLLDVQEDRLHPVKKLRPIASGAITAKQATQFLLIFLVLALTLSFIFLSNNLLFILLAYLFLNIAYSFSLKHIAVIDVVCIASGFVLRVCAGGIAAEVPVSHWLVIMVFLLSIFLALAKRRDDLILNAQGHNNTRRSLDNYNLDFVSHGMVAMISITIVSYILYTVSPEVVERHGTDKLYLTTFWVVIGFLRYMQITFVQQRSGSPTTILLKDFFLQTVLVLWLISFYLLLYVFH
jgi:decaprenyl-phosphate phosphoribosyltransferase